MATTTNYGWDTPDDTDLVKDGAAAIRTLGSSIDTTTKNLNPETTTGDIAYRSATANINTRLGIGSTGQVLTVAAGVPSWATPSDQTPLTTKGDIFTFSTVDARLGVGANGTVLTAASGEATGLQWAAPSAASFVGCNIYRTTGNQSIPDSTATAIDFNAESFDTDTFHDNVTNPSRVTIPSGKGGKYLFTAWASFVGNGTGYRDMQLLKNGTTLTGSSAVGWKPDATGYTAGTIAVILNLVATDYLEVLVTQTSGGNLALVGNIYGATGLSCVYLGA